MGRKLHLPKHQVLTDEDSSVNFTSKSSDCSSVDIVTYDITIDPSVIGTIEIQYSNDDKFESDSEWSSFDFGEPTTIDGAIETGYRFELRVSVRKTRIKFTNNAGSGAVNASVYGHGTGA